MAQYGQAEHVTDEERRDFLKAIGIAGAFTAGGVSLNELRGAVSAGAAEELAPIGQAIKADLTGSLNGSFIAEQQAAFASAVAAAPEAVESGSAFLPESNAFGAIAEEGWPVYEHLAEVGFFESTAEHMPAFNPQVLTESAQAFVGAEALVAPLEELGLSSQASVDLVVPTVNEAEKLSHFHWIASGGFPEDHYMSDTLPPITERAAGGVLLWFQNLDQHLYNKQILITDEILQNGLWDVQGMAAGFHLMAEGATAIADDSGRFSDGELAALFTTSIALQEIAQRLLPVHMHWITEEMRAPDNVEISSVSL